MSPGGDAPGVAVQYGSPLFGAVGTAVNYRPLGKTELEVSEVGFGMWTLASGRWGAFTDEQALDPLRKAPDAGEQLLGQAFQDRRELVIISSKAGRSSGRVDFPPTSIRASVDKTLERLAS